jgi:hypothetical protein
MADFLLTTAGDLDLSTNDVQIIEDLEAIRQELQIRYRFFLREWFLNPEEGIPYVEHVLKKNASETQIRAILTDVALSTNGVSKVRSLNLDLDTATRTLTVTMEFGAVIGGVLVYEPFIVEVTLI